jgi:hypothetical protein
LVLLGPVFFFCPMVEGDLVVLVEVVLGVLAEVDLGVLVEVDLGVLVKVVLGVLAESPPVHLDPLPLTHSHYLL